MSKCNLDPECLSWVARVDEFAKGLLVGVSQSRGQQGLDHRIYDKRLLILLS